MNDIIKGVMVYLHDKTHYFQPLKKSRVEFLKGGDMHEIEVIRKDARISSFLSIKDYTWVQAPTELRVSNNRGGDIRTHVEGETIAYFGLEADPRCLFRAGKVIGQKLLQEF